MAEWQCDHASNCSQFSCQLGILSQACRFHGIMIRRFDGTQNESFVISGPRDCYLLEGEGRRSQNALSSVILPWQIDPIWKSDYTRKQNWIKAFITSWTRVVNVHMGEGGGGLLQCLFDGNESEILVNVTTRCQPLKAKHVLYLPAWNTCCSWTSIP